MPLTQRATAIVNEIRNTSRLATTVQSIYDQLCATTTRVEQLAHASQAAIGAVQAQQAGNQLLAVLAQQQNGLMQLQANTARLQTLIHMKTVMADEATAAKAARWLEGWDQPFATPQPIKPPWE
jgi:conjugal transfer/entry exclusion protein